MDLASIVIRTYNEQKHLQEVLLGVKNQVHPVPPEVILVDSGSTDATLKIAEEFGVKIVHIPKNEFTFGRSLNRGCQAASGKYLVFVSGHCIPQGTDWLSQLLRPFENPQISCVYGRQIGGKRTKFSEHQLFAKYFPEQSQIPQKGFFSNNANAAIRREDWLVQPYDEELTGLEDMAWSKEAIARGKKIAYAADAVVAHIHDESWRTIRLRYERESIALQKIMPEVHIHLTDFLRYFVAALLADWSRAIQQKVFLENAFSIISFRLMQYWGSFRGNHEHRKLSKQLREKYFYPV
jgi:glycosyltransferase involved in cell wall biosynthesis